MTGIEMIAIERQEQIEKHKYSVSHDIVQNNQKELLEAAEALLQQHPSIMDFPKTWRQSAHTHKMAAKNYIPRLVIAGALIAAEIDRFQEASNP